MAHTSGAGPGGERHFGDQVRLDPVDGALQVLAGDLQIARGIGAKAVEAVAQHAQRIVGEAGADAAGIVQPALRVVVAEVERAQAGAAAGGFGPAEDQQLLAAGALHLQPVVAAAGTVGSVGLLADDPFQFHLAGGLAHAGGVAFVVVAVAQHAVPGVEPLEAVLAVAQGAFFEDPSRRDTAGRTGRRPVCRHGRWTGRPAARGSWRRRPCRGRQVRRPPSPSRRRAGSIALATAGSRSVQSLPLRVSSRTFPWSSDAKIR